jgi:magnesium transporter
VFLPIISDMSGCSGNQAVAVSIRELVLGLIKPHELARVIWKEASVGVINGILLGFNPLISEETRVYLRDCYNHTVQIIDLVETSRELCSDLGDYYLSTVNNRVSEVMRVLTIIASVFIPLGFGAGR